MILEERRHDKLWSSLLTAGTILVGLLSAAIVIYLPFSYQWLNSLLCASLCFFSIWLHQRRSNTLQNGEQLSRALLVLGIAEVMFSVLFLRAMTQNARISMWMNAFILISPAAYAAAFRLLFTGIFPRATKSIPKAAPDPLSTFPQPVREIMAAGRKRVTNPVAFSMLAFTLLGSITYLVSVLISGQGNALLFFIPAALGYLLGFPLLFFLTHRWQRWARQSGIPEEQLKAAARTAHLWWPRNKKDTRLEKPRKFTGS